MSMLNSLKILNDQYDAKYQLYLLLVLFEKAVIITIFALQYKSMKMKAIDINNTLVDGYLQLLENLSPNNKLDLISKLTLSIKKEQDQKNKSFYKAYGAWDSKQSADEIIDSIRSSRTFTRTIEKF